MMDNLQQRNDILMESRPINSRLENRVRYYETMAMKLATSYIVFQGLILHTVSTLSLSRKDHCKSKTWWAPFAISVLSSVVFFMAFIDHITRYYNTQYELDLRNTEQKAIDMQIQETGPSVHSINVGSTGESSSGRQMFGRLPPYQYRGTLTPEVVVQLYKRRFYITMTISILMGFTGAVLSACRSFLCNGTGSEV
ncbi:hypothetical protein Dsin_013873 [Dipteronia sinensis]|uniref:Uncharacterized protein n=1 Tax=Dipteronia sinensis TaxID=43782 RepID=A0AAE0AL86_9ROSI|nr:hypothetical protein Dsin_013873 [Dipteronia sinensis]